MPRLAISTIGPPGEDDTHSSMHAECLFIRQQLEMLVNGQSLLQSAIGELRAELCPVLNGAATCSPKAPDGPQNSLPPRSFDVDAVAVDGSFTPRSRGLSRQRKLATKSFISTYTGGASTTGATPRLRQQTFGHIGDASEQLSQVVHKASMISRFRMSCLTSLREEELCNIMRIIESETGQQSHQLQKPITHPKCVLLRLRVLARELDSKKFEAVFNSVIGLIIVANAICLGLSMDMVDSHARTFLTLDATFSILFLLELIVKVCANGFREQYCGSDAILNWFDAVIVTIDSIQLVMLLTMDDSPFGGSGNFASVFRMARLLRLSRIMRLLPSRMFRDLLAMVAGIRGGMTALVWSLVLFGLFVFVVSLIFREGLGNPRDSGEDVAAYYFQTVPRSMFTIFRCSFGDCSTIAGTPIFEHVSETHGAVWSFAYSLFLFLVVIGMFNVISAIFVENTMSFASDFAAKKRRSALHDEVRWAVNVMVLLQGVLNYIDPDLPGLQELTDTGKCSSELFNQILGMQVHRNVLESVLEESAPVQKALDKLDINPCDHKHLSDILDPHNRGYIGLLEIIDGIKRLRGDPRRSDIIAVDLMVRSLHGKADNIARWLEAIAKKGTKPPSWGTTTSKAGSAHEASPKAGSSHEADTVLPEGQASWRSTT